MKTNKVSFLLISVITLIVHSLSIQASNVSDYYDELRKELDDRKTRQLDPFSVLDSSKDKDIVVFLGATNAGKSTLINFLTGKKLEVQKRKIVLSNEQDTSAMKIGRGGNSETSQPQSVEYDNLWFYDFPGFEDTRGAIASLFHTGFIKNIVENAATTRFVFVAGEDELAAGRGKYIKNIIDIASHLAERVPVRKSSSLVITKSDRYRDERELGEEIENMCGKHEILTEWINKGRLSRMSFAREQIPEEERPIILKSIIETSEPTKIASFPVEPLIKGGLEEKIALLYYQAREQHRKSANLQEEKDRAIIEEMRLWILWYKANPDDRKHAKKLAKFKDHMNALENDEVIKFLKAINPHCYNQETKAVLKEYEIDDATLNWAKMRKAQDNKDQEKWLKDLSNKQREIVEKYINPVLSHL